VKLPSGPLPDAACAVVRTLRESGHEAFLAGGCVRDLLLAREPHDYDVATAARPEMVQALFPRTVAVGAQFGVIVVLWQGHEIQVATFRTDEPYLDGRHPSGVQFTTAQGDAERRDFTINGLFLDPESGAVADYVGGQADLEAGILRAIGDPARRFAEDKLRLLRAVRFAAQLGFLVEENTWTELRRAVNGIGCVSAERIRDELNKIFLSPSRVRGLDLLEESGLLTLLLPEVKNLQGCDQPPEFHPEGDVYVHTRLMLDLLPDEVSLPLVWSVLGHDLGKPGTRTVDETGRIRFNGHERVSADLTRNLMTRLRFSNQEIQDTVEMVRQHMAFKDVQNMRPAKLKRFLARPTFVDELELHRVDCLGSHGMVDNWDFLLRKREEFAHEPLIPPPLVTGHDLITMGFRPGPLFKEILEAVQTQQLENTLPGPEEARAWVLNNYQP
jgi:tRNA nucleotidyltransferase/poly(A) polymerase